MSLVISRVQPASHRTALHKAALLGALILSAVLPSSVFAQSTAFVDVHVVPMDDERILEHQTVLVEGDRIVAIGPRDEMQVPAEATVVEGDGRYLMPGLAEMHGHIPPPTQAPIEIENTLFLYAANGITTVRGMLGHPGQLELKQRALDGDLVSPTLYLAGPSFNGGSVTSPEHGAERVRTQHQEGWDLLKIHPGLTVEQYDAIAETANELGITFGGHVPAAVGLDHALDMGQETFDHIDGYVEALGGGTTAINMIELNRLVQKTIEKGAWIVPTMALWETLFLTTPLENMLTYDELKYTSGDAVRSWTFQYNSRRNSGQFPPQAAQQIIDARMQVLQALSDADARILMGTDAPQQFSVPGFSLHRELEVMADADMTPFEILETGTSRVGEYFAHKDTFGHVEVGHRADLVLVEDNPLEDIGHIADHAGVMLRGVWMSRADIDQRLAEIEAHYSGSHE